MQFVLKMFWDKKNPYCDTGCSVKEDKITLNIFRNHWGFFRNKSTLTGLLLVQNLMTYVTKSPVLCLSWVFLNKHFNQPWNITRGGMGLWLDAEQSSQRQLPGFINTIQANPGHGFNGRSRGQRCRAASELLGCSSSSSRSPGEGMDPRDNSIWQWEFSRENVLTNRPC